MKKLFKSISLSLLLALIVTLISVPAFAQSADVSPNARKRATGVQKVAASNSVVVSENVQPTHTYSVAVGKSYELPAKSKQAGDAYTSSNFSVLNTNAATGRFTTLADGTAYIVATNNGVTRHVKIVVGKGTAPLQAATDGQVKTNTDASMSASGVSFGKEMNAQREKNGLTAMSFDSSLQDLADTRAKELVEKKSHIRPDGTLVPKTYGYGEIILGGTAKNVRTAEKAFETFYASAVHRKLMMDADYTNFAVGYHTTSGGGHYWTVLFS